MVRPETGSSRVPLAPAQLRLWFLDRLHGGDASYNMCTAVRLQGTVDEAALDRSLCGVVARHESLRTCFDEIDGEPYQRVNSVPTRLLEREILEDATAEGLARRLSEEATRLFDLRTGPLFRARIFELGAGDYALLIAMHHVVSDGWSMPLIFREVDALYRQEIGGPDAELAPLPMQYTDYALWQSTWIESQQFRDQLEFWREELRGIPALLELPTDRPRPRIRQGVGKIRQQAFESELLDRLRAVSREHRCTLYMTLLAAYQVLLYRHSGQTDVVVGTPVAGRSRVEFEPLVGFFVNTLALRGDLSGNPTFGDCLQRTREFAIRAYNNQELPFESVVKAVDLERDTGFTPVFQTMFALQMESRSSVELEGAISTPLNVETGTSKFDLTLSMRVSKDTIAARWEYDSDLFDEERITRLSAHYDRLLTHVVADPQQRIGEIPLLGRDEREEVLGAWNATSRDWGEATTLHGLVERQAQRTPDAIAVRSGDHALSYAELDARSTDIAERLRALGVCPGSPVAVCHRRSAGLPVALLGVLKAGAAYVPLDPEHPEERLRFLLEDSAASVIVTEMEVRASLPAEGDRTLLVVDELGGQDPATRTPAPRMATPQDLAYVIYTSGSTGKPKGVCVEHASVVNLVRWAVDVFGETRLSAVVASSSVCFDISVFELFAPLACGGTTILIENVFDVVAIPSALQPSLLNTVPSAIEELMAGGRLPRSIHTVCLAGEALSTAVVDQLYELDHIEAVYDLYGPTEATVYATGVVRRPGQCATIGGPIANTQVYVLDEAGNPVPVGVVGELHIGGDGLAREYLGRPEVTAAAFLPNRFDRSASHRIYRTGDLVRWTLGGTLQFIGRRDNELKVRGFRVDPAEIETALAIHPGVRTSVVVSRRSEQGTAQLIGYVVPEPSADIDSGELRAFLGKRLPRYMIPSAFVQLESLPRTPSGKVDRRALPAPDLSPSAQSNANDLPRDEVEAALLEIWQSVLGRERIGIRDDFFAVGGDSLSAVRVTNQIERTFGIRVGIVIMFEVPTIEELAQHLVTEFAV